MVTHKEAFTFLNGHKLGVLSTVSENGAAWGAAIYFVVDDTLNFYFFTHIKSKKYNNITKHPQAGLTIADDAEQTTVQVSGKVTEVQTGDELDMAYSKLVHVHPPGQLSWVPPVSKDLDTKPIVLLKLTPEKLLFSVFKPGATHYESVTQII
jgi:nitroimidazol reductase NimA-like FMN-containing flavoprotein (pyridoxamine 5'-phosphate oxidase superfamily)